MLSINRLSQCGAVLATLLCANAASAVTINSFQFNGALSVTEGGVGAPATINFLPDFTIRSQNGAIVGDLIGLTGNIAGDYTFADPAGANSVLLASPTAPNAVTIFDGVETFTAGVDLFELQGGGGGSILGRINFASSNYTGANPGLIALNNLIQAGPNLTVTFQTLGGGGVDLDDLYDFGSEGVATYSAALRVNQAPTAVPEPAPLALLGLGLLCSVAYARRRSARSKNAA